jgi:hypothetical protein
MILLTQNENDKKLFTNIIKFGLISNSEEIAMMSLKIIEDFFEKE